MNEQYHSFTGANDLAHLADLEEQIYWRLGGRVRDFHLQSTEQGLVLRGRANSYYAKQLAQHAVMDAVEWPILANEIDVCADWAAIPNSARPLSGHA